uniref:Uncharacterized protein n=1 Tax=Musca domestica TaxID=7370 RepID=A0A1I8NA99_MUSDO
MAPQQQPPPHNTAAGVVSPPTAAAAAASHVAVEPKHSNPFYISAHYLCHNKRLKLKRSKYVEIFRRALKQAEKASSSVRNKNKTDKRRQKLNSLRAEVTIDLLSDDEEEKQRATTMHENVFAGKMCLERAAILGLMPVVRMSNGPIQIEPPPLVPLSKQKQTINRAQQQQQSHLSNQRRSLQIPPPSQLLALQAQQTQLQPQYQRKQQQQQQLQQQPARKRKSRPQRRSLPVLLNNESIVLSDDSDSEQRNGLLTQQSQFIAVHPDLAVIYPTNQSSPCQPAFPATTTTIPASSPAHCNTSVVLSSNSMQVDEDVTISLVPRSLNATTCARTTSLACSINSPNSNVKQSSPDQQQHPPPPFPMLPDETTVHTVIANRIYELSLTKLREGLASCGIPEFNDGQQKISPTRRKGMVQAPPVVTQPQAPISLKLSSDLSISLISDDEDDVRHHKNTNAALLSPAFLQKLPVNVSIAPVVTISPHPNGAAAPSMVGTAATLLDPRKLKFG